MPISIRLYLIDNKPDGMRTLEIPTKSIKLTAFPRPLLGEFLKRDEAEKPGVYMLSGDSLDSKEVLQLYIGEGDPVSSRLRSHEVKKDFWTEAYAFTSKDGYLSKTHIKYLEAKLIALAKEAGRVTLENVQSSNSPYIYEVDQAEVEQFYIDMMTLVSAMRLPFFKAVSEPPEVPKENEILFTFNPKGLRGQMVVRDGQYVLLAGSTASIKHYDAASNAIKKLRERLIADGALMKNESGYYDVVRDIPLNNPSYAAAIVAGGNTSGPAMWKHKGKALRDFEIE